MTASTPTPAPITTSTAMMKVAMGWRRVRITSPVTSRFRPDRDGRVLAVPRECDPHEDPKPHALMLPRSDPRVVPLAQQLISLCIAGSCAQPTVSCVIVSLDGWQVRTRGEAMSEATTEYDEIARVLQLYIEGDAKGDREKLREAFHQDARMFGSVGTTRYDLPIAEFIDMAVAMPADTGSYQGRVTSVTQVGDAAVAVVAEDGCWGNVSFVDFFSLSRIDGIWKIVNKSFAHTGGDLPAE